MSNFYTLLNRDNPLMDVYRHVDGRTGNTKDDPIPVVGDNNYNTSTQIAMIKVNIDKDADGTGDPQEFTHAFIKCNNVASYKVHLTKSDADDAVSTVVKVGTPAADFTRNVLEPTLTRTGPYQHDLLDFREILNVINREETFSITFEFTAKTGTSIEIYQILIMKHELYLDSEGFTDIEPSFQDRTGGIHTAMDGAETRYESLGTRDKIEIEYDKPIIVGARELEIEGSDGVITYMQPIDFVNRFQFFTHSNKHFVFERDYKKSFSATAGNWLRLTEYRIFRFMNKQTGSLVDVAEHQASSTEKQKEFTAVEVKVDNKYYRLDFTEAVSTLLNPVIGSNPPGPGWVEVSAGEETYPDDVLVFPDLVYISIFKNLELPTPFWSDVKTNGYSLAFQVCES